MKQKILFLFVIVVYTENIYTQGCCTVGVNLDGYRFGDEYILSLMGEYYFTDYLTLSVGMRARFAEEDFWNGRFLPSTGGAYYDILPGLIYSESVYSIKLFYQMPVYRNVKGIQLTTSNILGTEFLFNL